MDIERFEMVLDLIVHLVEAMEERGLIDATNIHECVIIARMHGRA